MKVYRVQVSGLPGCLLASVITLGLAIIPFLLLVLGLITLTMAVWIAVSIVLFILLSGLLRKLKGRQVRKPGDM